MSSRCASSCAAHTSCVVARSALHPSLPSPSAASSTPSPSMSSSSLPANRSSTPRGASRGSGLGRLRNASGRAALEGMPAGGRGGFFAAGAAAAVAAAAEAAACSHLAISALSSAMRRSISERVGARTARTDLAAPESDSDLYPAGSDWGPAGSSFTPAGSDSALASAGLSDLTPTGPSLASPGSAFTAGSSRGSDLTAAGASRAAPSFVSAELRSARAASGCEANDPDLAMAPSTFPPGPGASAPAACDVVSAPAASGSSAAGLAPAVPPPPLAHVAGATGGAMGLTPSGKTHEGRSRCFMRCTLMSMPALRLCHPVTCVLKARTGPVMLMRPLLAGGAPLAGSTSVPVSVLTC
mmetsp:Transcript_20652/g.61598  ORF Transcript_20652/g.61598 Transcript_20652/m.61598 type:complete len:355 (+) Transcript_20652:2296-3360(+)